MRSRNLLDLGAEDYVEKGPALTLVSKIERVLLRISERTLANASPTAEAPAAEPTAEKHGCKTDAEGKHVCGAEMKHGDESEPAPAPTGAPADESKPAP